ncbi:MAG: transporter [Verrucomicrobiales bacterium]|nr:transporter [Verrucomicrobiales bacterium]
MISASNLSKIYKRGAEKIHAVRSLDLEIKKGEFVAVTGPSGSGKSTLLNLLGCMDTPDSGVLKLDGLDVSTLSDKERTRVRGQFLGFIFQHFALIASLNVLENIRLPKLFGARIEEKRIQELLDRVGLTHRSHHKPHQLSGGEMQRVAIVRALIHSPKVVLADEPTGNLDQESGLQLMELLKQLNADGLTLVMVTHNQELARMAGRELRMRDGTIVP